MTNSVGIVSDLKDPDNYVYYIKSNQEFMNEFTKEYEAVKDLKADIKRIQKKIRSSSIKVWLAMNAPQILASNTDDNEEIKHKKTVILEPEDIIFTIRDQEIEGSTPNLVFEQKNAEGKLITQYMYLNQSYKPFLIYIWKTFEVIIYSRLKTGLLNQLLTQIKTMWNEVNFSAVLGSNSCFSAKLMMERQDDKKTSFEIDNSLISQTVMIKNITKIVNKRGKENVAIIDNNLCSYINYLEQYIPVPKFNGKENSNLFFLKFYLEDYLKGREPIWYHLLDEFSNWD